MVKSWILLFLLYLLPFISCVQKSQQLSFKETAKKSEFLPVTQFILGELHTIDSLPVTPLKIITKNGHTDSVWIKKEDVKAEALPFMTPIIDSAHQYLYFKESSFLDQTINSYTFSYDPIKIPASSKELKRWDVYVDPKKQTITRIYLLKESREGDNIITEQLTWKSNSFFRITLIKENKNGTNNITQEDVKWNFSNETL